MGNRPQSLEDRRSNLSDRMANGRENWQDRGGRQDDRQDWRNENREDWQNWADGKLENYGDWYHGGWQPGDGWNYMWDNYPVASAIGLTAWGINRIGYGWGYSAYSNPYYSEGGSYGYDYSQPMVTYADSPTTTAETPVADPSVAPPSSSQPQPTDEGMAAFEAARTAFYAGDYTGALTKLDITLKTMPRDTVVHEFRGLVLFALKKYPESSAAIYAILAAGPGWDWTTMISLYPGIDPYTEQLRALEQFTKANPQSPDANFLLAYHYQTCGHTDNAAKFFKQAQALLPDDKLLKQLVAMTAPADEAKKSGTPPAPPAVSPEKVLKAEQFVGTWKASTQGATFQLDMAKDGGFVWTYARGKQKQSIKGAFAVDQNNLALETEDGGGTMLAEINFTDPSQFQFKMIGDGKNDPGLVFKKN